MPINRGFTFQNIKLPAKQSGVVMVLMMFLIGLAVSAYLIKSLNAASSQVRQDVKTMQTLAEAKATLIAWAVSHPDAPGLMPYPDRNGDGNYDGRSDCYASNVNFAYDFTIGRLPLFANDPNCTNAKNTVISGLTDDFRDGTGERLWVEVSRNLLHDYRNYGGNPNGTLPIINPGIINTPTYPWFTVRDRNGAVISDRVAVVIIAPGEPIGAQNRSGGAPNPNNFLDMIVMASGTPYKNYTYPIDDTNVQNFIMGDDFRRVAKNDPTYKDQSIEPYLFNDKLVFITIDELMVALERRAAQEASSQLRNYYLASNMSPANRFYPYAATLGDANSVCSVNMLSGFLPIQPSLASCTSSLACTLSFPMTQIKFALTATENYGSSTGACSRSANTCTCTGAGSCFRASAPSRTFTCTAEGSCTTAGTNPVGSFTFIYIPKAPDVTVSSGACSGSNGSVICTGIGNFSSPLSTCTHPNPGLMTLPQWFTYNHWQDFMYYAISDDCNYAMPGCNTGNLTIGTKPNNYAIVVSAGQKLPTQSRPSNLITDYLDNPNPSPYGSTVFDAIGTLRTSTYNDQMFIVAP